ncbi:sensor histidine kinase [Paenibacillus lignilyticus]|uniref:histidine kinase n=1 Tax=Paenibacillus lignilyticus TaxID=1172615 RepID=A0ABS5CGJ8_9BACL|nr:sensor histidine kinase [Paenibacillus lignilyticus]MBP3964959.1 sensor histidine kinase [Paenibacillus lignilyticus]
MTFLSYLKDKRYYISWFAAVLLFVTVMLIVSGNGWSDVAYIDGSCIVFAAIYVVAGYYYRRSFYKELAELLHSGELERFEALPEPQNEAQSLYFGLLRSQQETYVKRLQQVQLEMKDHQDFVMSWIHEVKLPITASKLLLSGSDDKPVDELVDKLEDEISKIDGYVEQALYYSRIDSFSKDYFIHEIGISAVVKGSVKKYAKLFITKRIRFLLAPSDEMFVASDSKWLAFMIDQIMANALQYTAEGGEVTAFCEEDGSERRLVIRDTGIGIPPEEVHRVFDKGFTGSNGRSHTKSTGMGLYLVKQLAAKLGHEVSIASEEGAYTAVTIHFPKFRRLEL